MKKSGLNWLTEGFCFITVVLFILSGCKNPVEKKLQAEIDMIAAHRVPDHRVGICNIKLRTGDKGVKILSGETTDQNAKNEIIKTLDSRGIVLIDSIILLPDTIKNPRYFGLVTLSVINLRKHPDHASEMVSQAKLGTPVIVLKRNNSWILIQTPDNYISWTEESSVTLLSRMEISRWQKARRVIYLENIGWLYENPTDKSDVVGDLVGGSILEKAGEMKDYVSIIMPDGRKGFIEKSKVMDFNDWKSRASCTEENICKVARTFLGLPYLWGGSSAKGVDCSGFVQSVYYMNGIILERDASLQALHGTAVDITNGFSLLKKGDLLFFGSRNNGTPHVTHVAIYIGNKEYINSSGRVIINSFDSTRTNFVSYRLSSILSARRIIGVENDRGIIPVSKHKWY
jgi:gamma-D-glutamyl-L-lysine dipeptidyl-peptidase